MDSPKKRKVDSDSDTDFQARGDESEETAGEDEGPVTVNDLGLPTQPQRSRSQLLPQSFPQQTQGMLT